jgi:starch phosphorylase
MLAGILKITNGHLLISGKTHPSDGPMKKRLTDMLKIIDQNETLKKRVHYIVDYDEEAGRALSEGADIAINIPEVGKEACGTSFMKDIVNRALVVSTNDGGIADSQPPACLLVEGNNSYRESQSLYRQMINAAGILKDDTKWKDLTVRQLAAYPNIFGAHMTREYLDLIHPKEAQGTETSSFTDEATIFSRQLATQSGD